MLGRGVVWKRFGKNWRKFCNNLQKRIILLHVVRKFVKKNHKKIHHNVFKKRYDNFWGFYSLWYLNKIMR